MSARYPTLALLTLVVCLASSQAVVSQAPPPPHEKVPGAMSVIKAAPADLQRLMRTVDITFEPGNEGDRMPPAIYYSQADPQDFGTFLAVTDLSMCLWPAERCSAFRATIAGPLPKLGDDITHSRIGGVGYRTFFLARVDGVKLAGVDSMVAFLGADSLDSPASDLVLYVYAQRGSNLLQLNGPVGPCEKPAPENVQKDSPEGADAATPREKLRQRNDAYYRSACVTQETLRRARVTGKRLVDLFRLAP